MRVLIGPVPAASVTAWVDYARSALERVLADPGEDGVWLPEDTVTTFHRYLDDWEAAARASDPVHWSGEVSNEEGEYLSHAFFRIANALQQQAEERGHTAAPPESEAFYRALVAGFLDALDHAGESTSEFSEHLRSFWPGVQD